MADADSVYKMGMEIAGADPLAGVKEGMKLAEAQNTLQSQRADLDMKKAAIEDQKFNGSMNVIKSYMRAPPAVKKRMKGKVIERMQSYGNQFDETILDQIDADPQYANEVSLAMRYAEQDPSLTPAEKEMARAAFASYEDFSTLVKQGNDNYRARLQEEGLRQRNERALQSEERRYGMESRKQEAQQRKYFTKAARDAQEIFYKRLGGEDAMEALDFLQTGEAAVLSKNPIGDSKLNTVAAKLFEPGARLSDKDVSSLSGDGRLGNEFARLRAKYIDNGSSISPKDRKDYLDFFNTFRSKTTERVQKNSRIAAEQAAKANLIDDVDSIHDSILTTTLSKSLEAPSAASRPAANRTAAQAKIDAILANPAHPQYEEVRKRAESMKAPSAAPAARNKNTNRTEDVKNVAKQMLKNGAKETEIKKYMESVLGRAIDFAELQSLKKEI